MPQPKTIDQVMEQYRNKMFEYYKSEAWTDFIGYPLSWNDEFKQALADLLLGLPSLQDEKPLYHADGRRVQADNRVRRYGNHIKEQIRQEIAEALGVKEASGKAGEEI